MKKILTLAVLSTVMMGCASVATVDPQHARLVETLSTPDYGKAVIFVYRSNTMNGAALKRDLWINGECLGESARGVFFFKQVDGDKTHTVSTENMQEPTHLQVAVEAGKKYYFEQTAGVFTTLRQVGEAEGAYAVKTSTAAKMGNCGKMAITVPNS